MTLELTHFSQAVFDAHKDEAQNLIMSGVQETAGLFEQLKIRGIANEWLLKLPWKPVEMQMIFGDLLQSTKKNLKILEIAGSLSSITLSLVKNHDYTLVEEAYHETTSDYVKLQEYLGKSFIHLEDWYDFTPAADYDIVIVNDLFPNADQRLYEFIERYLPVTQELRMTLTYYEDLFFKVSRIESGETLTMRPWGLREITTFIEHLSKTYPQWCCDFDREQLQYTDYKGTLFTNKRNVLHMKIRKS